MNKKLLQSVVALLIGFFLVTLADLVPFWMPMMGEMLVLLLVTVLLLAWAAFVVFETASDEREIQLKMESGRYAYLAGIGILTLALVLQGLDHTIDPWIPIALATMVLVKLFTRLYRD